MRSANFTLDATKDGQGKTGASCYSAMISSVADAPGFMEGRAKTLTDGKGSSFVIGNKNQPTLKMSVAAESFKPPQVTEKHNITPKIPQNLALGSRSVATIQPSIVVTAAPTDKES